MIRALFVLSLVVAAVSAFVTPVNQAAVGPAFVAREAPKVNMIDNVADFSEVVNTSNMVASSVSDFGGYLFPVFGIGALAALILYLAPPLVDE
eukprot:CAMPEP_0176047570 /NCGR_PEP_ID=MMETSP0120_2-20121206/23626_1 /TAXON_ID=160619 /ORGANISM="Kryptoperidinium foliaceum, Strain CCMP 1326" /LENGTH=92 /DNA_ID=CAMNT_0017380985 /DNA_START=103 /DNA_END=381 /DNA_ORIENTATION=-